MKIKLLICSLFILISIKGEALTYYVNDASITGDRWCSAIGNDANNGTSVSTPKATLLSILTTYTLTANDIVEIDNGTYTWAGINWNASGSNDFGTSSGNVIIQGAGNSGTFTTNITCSSGILFQFPDNSDALDYITFKDMKITGASGSEIFYFGQNDFATVQNNILATVGSPVAVIHSFNNANNITITGNSISAGGSTTYGIYFDQGDVASSWLIEKNKFDGETGSEASVGIYLPTYVPSVIIKNNYFSNFLVGIQQDQNASGLTIYNNSFYCKNSCLNGGQIPSTFTVKNNSFQSYGTTATDYCLNFGGGSGQLTCDYNLYKTASSNIVKWNNSDFAAIANWKNATWTHDGSSVGGTAPGYTSITTGDLSIAASSAAENDGVTGLVTDDILGTIRSNPPEIGAFEISAVNFTTAQAGDWNTPATWTCNCLPPAGASITINHAVTVNGTVVNAAGPVTVAAAKSIAFGGGTLTVSSITNAGTLSNTSGTLTVSSGGTITNNSAASFAGGTVILSGAATIAGTTATTFNNLTINGVTTIATVPTINGILNRNVSAATVSAAPTYGASSTLTYSATMTTGTEWTATTDGAAGTGLPNNIIIAAGTITTASATRAMAGTLTIASGTTFSLGGDFSLRGNWTNNGGTLTTNTKTVFFAGTGTQIINKTGGETFEAVQITNTGGSVQLGAAVTISKDLAMTSTGTIDLNGNTLSLTGVGTNIDLSGGSRTIIGAGTLAITDNHTLLGSNGTLTISTATLNITAAKAITLGANTLAINGNLASTTGTFVGGATSNVSIGGTGALTGSIKFSSTLTLNNLILNRTSSGTLSLGSALSVGGILTLTSGVLTTDATNLLTVTASTTGSVSGGSSASYINGPLSRTIPASLGTGSTYTFPVGKGGYNPISLINPTTSAAGTLVVKAEVFDVGSGGSVTGTLVSLNNNRYWSTSITSGTSFTNSSIQLTDASVSATNEIGKSTTLTGTYSSIGGTPANPLISSTSATTTLNFFAIGSNASSSTFQDGDWNTTSTWIGNVIPAANANVVINHIVTVNSAVTNAAGSLTIASGKSLTFGGGTLTISSLTNTSGTLAATSGTLTVASAGTITNNGTATLSGGTVSFTGAGTVAGSTPVTFNNLTLNGTLTVSTSPTVNGNLKLNSGAGLSAAVTYGTSSTLVFSTGSTFTLTTGGGSQQAWVTGTSGAGVPYNVTVDGASVSGSALLMNAAVTYTARGNISITGNGSLTLSATGAPSNILNVGGNWTNTTSGTFTPNTNLVKFNGGAAQTFTKTGGSETFYDFEIANTSGDLTLAASSAITIDNSLKFTSGNIIIGNNTLTMTTYQISPPGPSIIGTPGTTTHIVTNGTGFLKVRNFPGPASFTFPIGPTTTTYNMATFESASSGYTTDDMSARVVVGVPADITNPLGFVNRTWFFEEGTIGGTNGDINIYWITSDENSHFTPNRASGVTYHKPSTTWNKETNTNLVALDNVSANMPAGGWRARSGPITSYSPFIEGTDLALPIELISFTGKALASGNKLEWTTASEINNDYFTVERSKKGFDFSTAGIVKGAGNSTGRIEYEFMDNSADALQNTISYYDLKQTDYDGKSSHSNIIAINRTKLKELTLNSMFIDQENQMNLYISSEFDEPVTIEITDVLGRTILMENQNHSNGSFVIKMPGNYSKQILILAIYNDRERIIKKFIY